MYKDFCGKVPVSITTWVDSKHKNLYEPNVQSYASFQKTQLETTGQLAPLKVGTIDTMRAFMPVENLAKYFQVDVEALRKRLERHRAKYILDTDFYVESQDRGTRKPKYLYNVIMVAPIAENLKKKQTSVKHPSRKK